MRSTKRDCSGGDDKLVGIDAQFLGDCHARSSRPAAQQVPDLLTFESLRFLERLDRPIALTQDRLDIFAVNNGGTHGR